MDKTNATSPAALAPAEFARLATLESVVERGRVAFLAVGRALTEIRDARLYRADYGTFAAYLAQRWGWKRSHGYELIAAAGGRF